MSSWHYLCCPPSSFSCRPAPNESPWTHATYTETPQRHLSHPVPIQQLARALPRSLFLGWLPAARARRRHAPPAAARMPAAGPQFCALRPGRAVWPNFFLPSHRVGSAARPLPRAPTTAPKTHHCCACFPPAFVRTRAIVLYPLIDLFRRKAGAVHAPAGGAVAAASWRAGRCLPRLPPCCRCARVRHCTLQPAPSPSPHPSPAGLS